MWFLRGLLFLLIACQLTGCILNRPPELPKEEPPAKPVRVDFNPEEIQGFYHAYHAYPAHDEIDFNVALSTNGIKNSSNTGITLVITLQNDASYPVYLNFKDGEMFEVIFESGEVNPYHWTDNHYVMNVPYTLQFKAGEIKRFIYNTTMNDLAQYLPRGGYTVRIRSNSSQPFEATTGFSF
jgi:hypothetical protein